MSSYNILKHCKAPCNVLLKCEHRCAGTCGECAQGRVHKQCQEKCGSILICGHECQVFCREACQPCKQPCSFKCKHSKCKKKCGEPCTSCSEPCPRRCKHSKCNKKCGAKCSVPPCDNPCEKILKCGHPCVGFCGDPCPELCRICNYDELTEIFFGIEQDEGARFVYLEECGHTIESTSMDAWIQSNTGQIGAKHCPKCKTKLTSTLRYSDFIKEANNDIFLVKRKFFGSVAENNNKKLIIEQKLLDLRKQRIYSLWNGKWV